VILHPRAVVVALNRQRANVTEPGEAHVSPITIEGQPRWDNVLQRKGGRDDLGSTLEQTPSGSNR
jgi:hypothetical protein